MGNNTKIYNRPNPDDVRVGNKIGRLTLIEKVWLPHGKRRETGYLCVCDCGNETIVYRSNILKGVTTSCGCFHDEVCRNVQFKHGHGLKMDKTYMTWARIKSRCNNQNSPDYDDYGGRGIKVCDRWSNSFNSFLEDMGYPPDENYSIDRINPDGNYEPNNCRWASPVQQARNKRNTIRLPYDNEMLPIGDIADRLGITYKALYQRLAKYNWDIEKAAKPSIGTNRKQKEYYGQ